MYHSFLIHSSADGHLGCFHVLLLWVLFCLQECLMGFKKVPWGERKRVLGKISPSSESSSNMLMNFQFGEGSVCMHVCVCVCVKPRKLWQSW